MSEPGGTPADNRSDTGSDTGSDAGSGTGTRGGPGARGPLAQALAPLPAMVAAAVAGALVWWLVVPSAVVVERRGVLVTPDRPELFAAHDAVFALLGVGLGLLTGTALLLRPGRQPVLRLLVVVAGSALASLAMWRLGALLGATGPADAAPLTVHATGVLVLWPAVTATVAFAGQLWADLAGGRRPSRSS